MNELANVDLIDVHSGKASGNVAQRFSTNQRMNVGMMRPFLAVNKKTGFEETFATVYVGGDPKRPESYKTISLQTNATLRRDEWKQLDSALMEVSRQRLNGVQDLLDNGLIYNLGNAMGTTILEWHDVSDFGEAQVTMDGVNRGNNDRPNFQFNYLPIPIIHYDYEINLRALEASRSLGNPLDTTTAERAARRVAETIEKMLFTNTSYSFGEKDNRNRNAIYSYVNFPDRNVKAIGTPWTSLSSNIGTTIVKQIAEMKQISINNYHYGPWMLYIPTGYETLLDTDYDTVTPGTTIRERILKIAGIKGIKVVDTLSANNVLLVQMTSDVVRLVRGLPLQNVEWKSEGNFVTNYKVLTIQVPQIRSDQNGKCGIVHMA